MDVVDRDNPPYWPGGIPPEIRCHPDPIPGDDVEDEIKGWRRFLEENAVPRPPDQPSHTGEYELSRRRAVMLQWASMSPEQRLAYYDGDDDQSSSATPATTKNRQGWKPPAAYFAANVDSPYSEPTLITPRSLNCIAPQPMSARHRAAWAKLRILLYKFDGSDDGPLLSDGDVSVCVPNPVLGPGARLVVPPAGKCAVAASEGGDDDETSNVASPAISDESSVETAPTTADARSKVTTEDFLMWRFVESADFHRLAMTRAGTVIFPPWFYRGPLLLADEKALETGLLLLCELENNGQRGAAARMLPGELYSMWLFVDPAVLSKSVEEIVCSFGMAAEDDFGDAVDMEKPLLEILNDCKQFNASDIDDWRDDIERWAPGYLEMEAAGNGFAPDYDCSKLRNSDQLAGIPREERIRTWPPPSSSNE